MGQVVCWSKIIHVNGLLCCPAGRMHAHLWTSAIFSYNSFMYTISVCRLCAQAYTHTKMLVRLFVFSLFMTPKCGRIFILCQLANK